MVGELVITEAMLCAQARRFSGDAYADLIRGIDELSHHTRELQERFWRREGLDWPSNRIESGDISLVLTLLQRLPLLALMPEDSARAAARAGLAKILPLDVPIGLSDLVAWHLPPSSTFSPSAQTSLKRLLHHLSAAAALKP